MQEQDMQAEISWFHMFRNIIESGDMLKMGGSTFMVYTTIKAYSTWDTKHGFPKINLIAEKTGLSVRQVMRALKKLEEMGHIIKDKQKNTNIYTIKEKISISDKDGMPTAMATWDYIPSGVKAAQAELKNFLMTGDKDGARVIHIENLTIINNTQIINDGSTGTQINSEKHALNLDKLPKVKERVELARKNRAQKVREKAT